MVLGGAKVSGIELYFFAKSRFCFPFSHSSHLIRNRTVEVRRSGRGGRGANNQVAIVVPRGKTRELLELTFQILCALEQLRGLLHVLRAARGAKGLGPRF